MSGSRHRDETTALTRKRAVGGFICLGSRYVKHGNVAAQPLAEIGKAISVWDGTVARLDVHCGTI